MAANFGKPIPKAWISFSELEDKIRAMGTKLWECEHGTFLQRKLKPVTLYTLRIEAQQCLTYSHQQVSLLSPPLRQTLGKILAKDGILPERFVRQLNLDEIADAAD